ncbi:uncharacterized protein LOC132655437 [Meriones unguiculatus]|uniref:uncharacterized protein LOC132655437 n=1 Tax=Meriones unguiculatus TaxID=10047 RepID=UPI00293F2B40|nr:uncharacterized protein LOC132655437 [Meriones unguiculatus]
MEHGGRKSFISMNLQETLDEKEPATDTADVSSSLLEMLLRERRRRINKTRRTAEPGHRQREMAGNTSQCHSLQFGLKKPTAKEQPGKAKRTSVPTRKEIRVSGKQEPGTAEQTTGTLLIAIMAGDKSSEALFHGECAPGSGSEPAGRAEAGKEPMQSCAAELAASTADAVSNPVCKHLSAKAWTLFPLLHMLQVKELPMIPLSPECNTTTVPSHSVTWSSPYTEPENWSNSITLFV